jgi:Raf kinase inhibitor-like YbhB/YbcL family protein
MLQSDREVVAMPSTRIPGLCVVVLAVSALVLGGLVGCDRGPQAPRASKPPPQPAEQQPASVSKQPGETPMKLTIQSTAFSHGQTVPRRHTGDGEDLSPALTWSDVPPGTKELALIVDDPDAPTPEPWVHWVLYKIPADVRGLPEAVPSRAQKLTQPAALQGRNSWNTIGYRGPAPPKGHGLHHYRFRLYALDAALPVESGLDKRGLLKAMSGHILAEGELVGTYQR